MSDQQPQEDAANRPSQPSGPEDTVLLISKTGEKFPINLKAAKLSGTLSQLLEAAGIHFFSHTLRS